MAAVFQLDVLAASVPFFQGKCVSAVIPVTDGEYGVLAGHSNAVGAVCAGELRFETENGEHRRAAVAPGLFKIDGDRVLLLLDAAEWPEDIDVNRALRARREASPGQTIIFVRTIRWNVCFGGRYLWNMPHLVSFTIKGVISAAFSIS